MASGRLVPRGPRGLRRWLEEMEMPPWPLGGRWPLFAPFAGRGGPWAPAVDVIEKENEVIVKADLPGVKREGTSVTVEEGALVIRAERRQEEDVKEQEYHRIERSYGRFERILPLPDGADAEAVRATYNDGVLEITIPIKREEPRPATRKIVID